MGALQRGDGRGKRAVGLTSFAVQQWHEVEYRFAQLGIHEPEQVEYGRFCRLLLASLHDGLTMEQRASIDAALSPADPDRPVHPGAKHALGMMASAEYQRVMTDPRSTPEERAAARVREVERIKRRGGR